MNVTDDGLDSQSSFGCLEFFFPVLSLHLSEHPPEAVSVGQRRLDKEEDNEFCVVLQSRMLGAFTPCHTNLHGA